MGTVTASRKFAFDAAHRVWNHGSKCRHLHGHRYVAHVTVTAPELNSLGMVTDFSCLKTLIGEWIDREWDHNILLSEQDTLATLFKLVEAKPQSPPPTLQVLGSTIAIFDPARSLFQGKAPYIMRTNPTAENIAKELYRVGTKLFQESPNPDNKHIQITSVVIWETENCYATFIPNGEEKT